MYKSINDKFVNSTITNTGKEIKKSYQEYVPLEFCVRHPFKTSFFLKVQYLSVILHRLHCLLVAEHLRQVIWTSGLISSEKFRSDQKWPFFSYKNKNIMFFLENKDHTSHECETNPAKDIIKQQKKIISFCRCLESFDGPSPANILESITLKCADVDCNLERLETLGDSFIKYCISLKLFVQHKNEEQNMLANFRTQVISNSYLFQKITEKQIDKLIIVDPFQITKWLPPSYRRMSNEPIEKKKIYDKQISDSLESLAGTYLVNMGQQGAIMFLHFVGLDPFPVGTAASEDNVLNWPYVLSKHFKIDDDVSKKGNEISRESLLNNSLTHVKCLDSRDVNRLQFLGNSIIEYIITRVLYDDPRKLSPCKMTNYRMDLTNNVFYATMALNANFQEHVSDLAKRRMNPDIDNLMKSEYFTFTKAHSYPPKSKNPLESFPGVVRTMSRLFQAVAGDIYLSNRNSMDAVWCVYSSLLEPSFEAYTKEKPVPAEDDLKELLETNDIYSEIYSDLNVWTVKIMIPGGMIVEGKAKNLKKAKGIAVGMALEAIKSQEEDNLL